MTCKGVEGKLSPSRFFADREATNLRLVLQILNRRGVFQSPRFGSEQDDGFEARELRGVDEDRLEAAQHVVQRANVYRELLLVDAGPDDVVAVLGDGEQGAVRRVQRHTPLNRVQQEQLRPRFFE